MTLRRDFLGFTMGAVAARTILPIAARAEGVAVMATPSPDADLIAVCTEYLRIQRAFEAGCTWVDGNIEDDDPAWAMLDPVDALVERIVALPATTAEGHLARAQCAAFHTMPKNRACQDDPQLGAESRFSAANLRDAVRMVRDGADRPVVTVAGSTSPDANLLEACAAYLACEASRPVPVGQARICNTPECDRHEAIQEDITERANDMVHGPADMPAVTREGMQAKARAILLWDGGNALKGEPDDYSGDRLMASLMRDLLA